MNKPRQTNWNNEKGFTLVELMVAMVIISILASVAISKFNEIKTRTYDTNAQVSLRSIYQACQDYWTFNSSSNACSLTSVSDNGFGYSSSPDVDITIDDTANNTESDFVATARHASSPNIFVIDHFGTVSKLTVDVAMEEDDDNNGGGCSEQAKVDPKKLGKNTKGCKS